MGRRARLAGLERAGSEVELELAACAAAAKLKSEMSLRFPQQYRGITLGELRDFYHQNREFIEEKVWRCSSCATTPWAFKFSGGPAALQREWYDAGTHAGRRQYFNLEGGTIKWGTSSGKAAWVLCLGSVPTYYNTGNHPPTIGWISLVEPHPGHITMKDAVFEVVRGAEYCARCYGRKGKWETKNMHEVAERLSDRSASRSGSPMPSSSRRGFRVAVSRRGRIRGGTSGRRSQAPG
ncbi:unnamed protein product [Prorocentrum cordatum]|uniref:Uncharacterized protein n=1 Tax=Prorocentrum cordatum TaxID=2364126 RepID=A0ABN9SEZ9_9DINO|nr:unnamed protein product [Polarella glacialis]